MDNLGQHISLGMHPQLDGKSHRTDGQNSLKNL